MLRGRRFDHDHLIDHGGGAFTIWFDRNDIAVGVLTHQADDDYDLEKDLIGRTQPLPLGTADCPLIRLATHGHSDGESPCRLSRRSHFGVRSSSPNRPLLRCPVFAVRLEEAG